MDSHKLALYVSHEDVAVKEDTHEKKQEEEMLIYVTHLRESQVGPFIPW